jgi:hypothetical protein
VKELIQVSLIIILVLVSFQAVAGELFTALNHADLGTASTISSLVETSIEGSQMAACLVSIKGVICVKPNVGWNS